MAGRISKISGLGQAVGAINSLIDALARVTPIESPNVKPSFTGSGVSLKAINTKTAPNPTTIKTPEDFGIKSILKNVVTIYAGKIWLGVTEYSATDSPFTITSDCYIGWEFTMSTKAFSIVNFGSTVVQDLDHIRKPLYHFTYTAPTPPATVGTVRLDRLCSKSEVIAGEWGAY